MEEYALLIDGVFKEIRTYDEKPVNIPHKNVTWHSVLREYGEQFEGLEQDVWVIRTTPPNTIPVFISARQVRLLLLQQNMLTDVENMISQQDRATQISWEYANEFYRNDPLLNQLAVNFNLTQEQLDQFFLEASAL